MAYSIEGVQVNVGDHSQWARIIVLSELSKMFEGKL